MPPRRRYPKELREHLVSLVLYEQEKRQTEKTKIIAETAAIYKVPPRRLSEWVRKAEAEDEFKRTIAGYAEQIADLKMELHKLVQMNEALMTVLTQMAKKL